MKRVLKVASLLLVLSMMLTCLCGCNQLDELKNRTGVYTDSSNIKFNGHIYMPLSVSENLMTSFPYDGKDINVTAEDVPVLLSLFMGEWYMISTDGVLMQDMENSETTFYCRSDRYEQISEQIKNGLKVSKYRYEYYIYSDDDYAGEQKYYDLSNEEIAAVNTVLSSNGEVLADDMNILMDYSVTVNACGEDGYFSKFYCEINVYNGQYSVVTYTDSQTLIYRVPEEMNTIFENLMSKYIKSEQFWNE